MARYTPWTRDELEEILTELVIRQQKEGHLCTEGFKDVDVSAIDNMNGLFCADRKLGTYGFFYGNTKLGAYCNANVNWNDPRNDIGGWNVSGVKSMEGMFCKSCFNGDISQWNVSNVKSMKGMFIFSEFNRDVSNWNVSSVENMSWMFASSKFDREISGWDVSSVENMKAMFMRSRFDRDISNWNVRKVKDMSGMFQDSRFNRDISCWDVGNVESMRGFVYNAEFSQSLMPWILKLKPTCDLRDFNDLSTHEAQYGKIDAYSDFACSTIFSGELLSLKKSGDKNGYAVLKWVKNNIETIKKCDKNIKNDADRKHYVEFLEDLVRRS